jgi:hypothetical protein
VSAYSGRIITSDRLFFPLLFFLMTDKVYIEPFCFLFFISVFFLLISYFILIPFIYVFSFAI